MAAGLRGDEGACALGKGEKRVVFVVRCALGPLVWPFVLSLELCCLVSSRGVRENRGDRRGGVVVVGAMELGADKTES